MWGISYEVLCRFGKSKDILLHILLQSEWWYDMQYEVKNFKYFLLKIKWECIVWKIFN